MNSSCSCSHSVRVPAPAGAGAGAGAIFGSFAIRWLPVLVVGPRGCAAVFLASDTRGSSGGGLRILVEAGLRTLNLALGAQRTARPRRAWVGSGATGSLALATPVRSVGSGGGWERRAGSTQAYISDINSTVEDELQSSSVLEWKESPVSGRSLWLLT